MPLNFLNNGYFAGSVGIGTESPGAKLEVKSSANLNSFVNINTTTDAYNSGISLRQSSNYGFDVYYTDDGVSPSVRGLYFDRVNNGSVANAMFIDRNSGNVGIGTTSPAGALSVENSGTAGVPVLDIINTSVSQFNHSGEVMTPNMTTGQNNIFVIGRASSTKNSGYIGYKYSGTAGSNANVLTFGHWGSDNLMNIDGLGNVGIGTTGPDNKLVIADDSGAGLEFIPQTSNDRITLLGYDRTASTYQTIDLDASELHFNISGTEKMRVNSAGNVGIGETDPKAPGGTAATTLTLKGTNFPQFISVASNATANSTTWRSIARDNLVYQIQTVNDAVTTEQNAYEISRTGGSNSISYQRWYGGTTEAMRITSAGGISFGSTGTAYGTSGQVLTSAGNASPTWTTPTTGTVTGTGAANRVTWWDSATNITSDAGFTYNGAGRVNTDESFGVSKNGADTVADGPFFRLTNAAQDRQYIWQLDASNNIDYWYYNGSTWAQTISLLNNGGAIFTGNVNISSAALGYQENTDVDTGTETVAEVSTAAFTAAFFDFVIKKTTNVRSGTVYACHDGAGTPLIAFTETSTQDLGDTSDVTLSVDISGGSMRLRATTTSDDWSIKSLIRAI